MSILVETGSVLVKREFTIQMEVLISQWEVIFPLGNELCSGKRFIVERELPCRVTVSQ